MSSLEKYIPCIENKIIPCQICPLAKQRRLPFKSNNHLSENAFDLIHLDIWGPFHTASHSGHRYFLTLVDDRTRFTRIYLLKQKSKAESSIRNFLAMISNQFQVSIKKIRSDNARELHLTQLYNDNGIIHQL